jgi:hypothetical protein
LNRNLSNKGKITVGFVALLLMTTFIASFLVPQVTATPTITTITPNSGSVGTTVNVVGEIDTANGSYVIYFDHEEVKNGTAVEMAVDDIFVTPHRPEGNYTVILHDVTENTNDTATFTIETAYYIEAVVPTQPEQLQEGELTEILVNVTGGAENTRYWANLTVIDPSGAVYNDTLQLTNTTSTGHGWGNRTYPTNFSIGAHTNYTGTYEITFNKTLATESFFIGLTNATEYNRFQVVSIRATNYTQPNEHVWVNITFAGKTLFSENVSAIDGVIESDWKIPENASYGTYDVIVTNSTPSGTIKSITDTQDFTIVKAFATLQTRIQDISGQPVIDATVEVFNSRMDKIDSKYADRDGLANFSLEAGSYTIKAQRHGFLFDETFIELLPLSWVNMTMACPTYTMFIQVQDSQGLSLQNVQVIAYEWNGSVLVRSGYTNDQGKINFSLTFGRYKVKVYDDNSVLGREVVLNETLFDLIEDGLSVVVHCRIFNVDLSVKTLDYFGQPVPNAVVKIERKFGQEWIEIGNSTTSLDGLASLNSIIGGDYRVSIYLGGKLAGINQLYVGESKQILSKIDGYAVIGGYSVEILQLITYISIVLLVVVFSLALTYRRLLRRFLKKTSESEE